MKEEAKELWLMIGTTVAVYGAIRFLLPLVVPFLFSYFFAKLLYPLIMKIKKKWRVPEIVIVTLVTGLVTVAAGTGIFFLLKAIINQISRFLKHLPIYEQQMMLYLENICTHCDRIFSIEKGSSLNMIVANMDRLIVNGREKLAAGISLETILQAGKILGIFWVLFMVVWGMIMIVKDMDELRIIYEESFLYRHASKVFKGLAEIGMAYGKAEFTIMTVVFFVCTAGFLLIGNSYAILLGLLVSVLDAFPVLGSGLILVPWAVISLLKGNWFAAAVLVTVCIICQIVREWLEAKILGSQIGIKPIFTIMAMYAGVQLFGVFGFILGPIALMIIKTVLQNQW